MLVYTLQAHASFNVLANQVRAICNNLNPNKIIVVQGPYGRHGDTDRRLTVESAAALGVEILEAPRLPAGGTYSKQPTLYAWLLNEAIPAGQPAIVLHGDCFPTRPMKLTELLDGFPVAGRGHWNNENPYLEYTWLAVNGDERPRYDPPYWNGRIRLWPARREGQYEICEPGFWHADRINLWHRMDAADKLAEVGKKFPADLAAQTEPPPKATVAPRVAHATTDLPIVVHRLAVCHRCHDRPEGCWRAKEYGCQIEYMKAARHAAETRSCPIGKLN